MTVITDAADTQYTLLEATLTALQATELGTTGRYWQALRTHSTVPTDGATALPSVGTATPSDIVVPWPAGIRATALAAALEIHAYAGPLGRGYVVLLGLDESGQRQRRDQNYGPETWRTTNWRTVDAS